MPVLLPDVELPATAGDAVNPSKLGGRAVIFCYPYTGKPGVADPPGWDDIPGAHGSTPQAKAYQQKLAVFQDAGIAVYGLSFQDIAWQREFARRCGIGFPLLSDADRNFSRSLGLETFAAGPEHYLRRITLVASDARILHRHTPSAPDKDAEEVLTLIQKGLPA